MYSYTLIFKDKYSNKCIFIQYTLAGNDIKLLNSIIIIEIVVRSTTDLTISEILNNELSMVNNWLKVNKLSLNIKKSKYMIFHTKKTKVQSLTLKIDNVNIERVAEFNFL